MHPLCAACFQRLYDSALSKQRTAAAGTSQLAVVVPLRRSA